MKNPIQNLNRLFESRVRLGIMSTLMVNDWVNFNELKELLEVTDGNLASHLKALEKHKYVDFKKQFVRRKPQTSYCATQQGQKAFLNHLNALETLMKNE